MDSSSTDPLEDHKYDIWSLITTNYEPSDLYLPPEEVDRLPDLLDHLPPGKEREHYKQLINSITRKHKQYYNDIISKARK